jgi:hypothetical protein
LDSSREVDGRHRALADGIIDTITSVDEGLNDVNKTQSRANSVGDTERQLPDDREAISCFARFMTQRTPSAVSAAAISDSLC